MSHPFGFPVDSASAGPRGPGGAACSLPDTRAPQTRRSDCDLRCRGCRSDPGRVARGERREEGTVNARQVLIELYDRVPPIVREAAEGLDEADLTRKPGGANPV